MLHKDPTEYQEQINLFVLVNILFAQGAYYYFTENFMKFKITENVEN
jgi:hypothetical protein